MDDTYKYPVYFECRNLPDRRKKRIENHFRIRRRSGASDCGQLRSVNERTCCVAFKCQEEQQEVLRRGRHVVALGDGDLVLMVRGSLEPLTSTLSQDLPATAQSQMSIPSLSPSGEECELQLDDCGHLEEHPEAKKELENPLASVACSAELHAEEGSISVPTPTRPDAVDRDGVKECDAEVLQAASHGSTFRNDAPQTDQVPTTKRIVLLGKTGCGKSNLANTILGEELFYVNHSPNSGTQKCQAETKRVNGRGITLIDTPGFFDSGKSEEELKPEILRCIIECTPGPHAFLIVLKVEKFTEHEKAVIAKICQYFTPEALKYAVVVFTHGDQLPKGMKIEDFFGQNRHLSDLVKKCGNRCHVVDNKLWGNEQEHSYRANRAQVEKLLNTVDKMIMENDDGYYTNEIFQKVNTELQTEEQNIRQLSQNMPLQKVRVQARESVFHRLFVQLSSVPAETWFGAFFGVVSWVGFLLLRSLR